MALERVLCRRLRATKCRFDQRLLESAQTQQHANQVHFVAHRFEPKISICQVRKNKKCKVEKTKRKEIKRKKIKNHLQELQQQFVLHETMLKSQASRFIYLLKIKF